MAQQNFVKRAVGWLRTLFHHSDKQGVTVGEKDGPIEPMGDTKEDAGMDALVAESGSCSSDYPVKVVRDQAKMIQLPKEEIQVSHHRATLQQQNHTTSHLGISKEVKDKYGSIEPMRNTSKETVLVKRAAMTDASCSENTESSDNLIENHHPKKPRRDTSKETTLVKHAAISSSCSKDMESSDNLIENRHLKNQEMVKITESSDALVDKQGILIQHLEEKIGQMVRKIIRMEQVLKQLDADHQEALLMLDIAKHFFDCFKPTQAAANATISFFSENDENIVQKINYMKDFFSYYVPPDHVRI